MDVRNAYHLGRFRQHFARSFCTCRSQKRKKYSQAISLFVILGSAHIKALNKMFVKLTPGSQVDVGEAIKNFCNVKRRSDMKECSRDQFHHHYTKSFCKSRFTLILKLLTSQKRKTILMTWLNVYAFGSYGRKSCT